MCGIAGYLTESPFASIDRSLLAMMCDRLRHRGPDAEGYFCGLGVGLGHRRLSVIDVDGGHQPLGNEDGSIQVVFNGEVYNYRALRSSLVQRGHHFRTRSDTEVLVHLYEETGERLPEYLVGMFAFAIWDARRRELFLARDRFGEKPLYYTFSIPETRFCFASELTAFAELPGFPGRMDVRSLANFLALSYVPGPETIYEDVFALEPAHSLTVSATGTRARRYWTPDFSVSADTNVADAVEQIQDLADEAVRGQMVSDVPLGAFLSGGVDSSTVVALMSRNAPSRVKTFSIGFTEKEYDELRYARMTAERNRTDHHEEIVSHSVHDALRTLVESYDQPFGDSSAIPTLYLARLARRNVTVALCGDGADELFAGYRRYYWRAVEEKLRTLVPEPLRHWIQANAGPYSPSGRLPQASRAKATLVSLSQAIGDAYFTYMSTFRDDGLRAVLSPDLRSSLGDFCPRQSFRARFDRVNHLSPLQQMQAVDLETYLPGDILVKLDRATMAHSLESRAPWLDHRLAELACRLPSAFKLRGRAGKYIFKRAFAPLLPRPVIRRKKMGFGVPLDEWFRTGLRSTFENLVLTDAMEGCLRLDEVRRIWREHQSCLWNHGSRLWNVLVFACWHARRHGLPYAHVLEEAAECEVAH